MQSKWKRIAIAGVFGLVAAIPAASLVRADEAAPAAPPAQASPASPAPAGGAAPAEPPAAQTPAPPAAAETPGATPEAGKPGSDSSTGETVDLSPRAFAYIEGKAEKDEIYSAILGSLGLVKRDLDKAGLKPAGRPMAVFVESDDSGFRYHAGYPLDAAPDGKPALSDAVKIGQTPGGKSMRFQYAGAYGDIDATYDAITAYLDEKGIDAQDSFIEEYVNDVKDADDPTLQVNIYVLLK
jgi:effector-binding domain-containing protein